MATAVCHIMHALFSTKDQAPLLEDPAWRAAMHTELGAISARLACPAVVVGGLADHVHILAHLAPGVSVDAWLAALKQESAAWAQAQPTEGDTSALPFAWQAGGVALSVSHTNLDHTRIYIVRQEAHHSRLSYRDEVRGLLRKHKLEWDEAQVWE